MRHYSCFHILSALMFFGYFVKWQCGPPIIQQPLAEQKRTCRLVALETASVHIVNVTYTHKVASNLNGKPESCRPSFCVTFRTELKILFLNLNWGIKRKCRIQTWIITIKLWFLRINVIKTIFNVGLTLMFNVFFTFFLFQTLVWKVLK